MIRLTSEAIIHALPCDDPGEEWLVHIEAGQYGNGRIALELVDAQDGERVRVGTVNLVDAPLAPGCVHVKDYSENEGMAEWLIRADIIEPEALDKVATGHVIVRSYRLTQAARDKIAAGLMKEAVDQVDAARTVQYLVTAQLRPGCTAPSPDELQGALLVGMEGAPEEMGFECVGDVDVEAVQAAPATMDQHIRLNVRASFSITLGLSAGEKLGPNSLRDAVAQNIIALLEAGGPQDILAQSLDVIEIAEIADANDQTIMRGTNG